MTDLKQKAKRIITKLLRELETALDEADRSGIPIEEIAPDLLFPSVKSFSEALGATEMFSISTARDALQDLIDNEEITKSKQGFFVLKRNSTRIDSIIKYQLYATPLPLEKQTESIHYIEVSDNMAPFLADLFNKSMHRNDKRFFSVAPNLLLLLDLAIPSELSIVEKQPFNLTSFFKSYGITVRDYNTICQEIKGKNFEELLEEEHDATIKMQEFEATSNQHGKLNTPRSIKLKPRTSIDED